MFTRITRLPVILVCGLIGTLFINKTNAQPIELDPVVYYAITNSTYPAGWAYGLAVGDINGNGYPDIAVTGGKFMAILTNLGDGTFAVAHHYTNGVSTSDVNSNLGRVLLVDLNNDQLPEIVTGNSMDNFQSRSITVWPNDGFGNLGEATVYYGFTNAQNLIAGDFDNDGANDIVVKTEFWASVARGNGDGTLGDAAHYFSLTGLMAAGDINSDGKTDLIASGSSDIRALLGVGNGSFSPMQTVVSFNGDKFVSLVDLNRDGHLDILLGGSTGRYFLGRGDGTFQSTAYQFGQEAHYIQTADLNGDGVLDLVHGNYNLRISTGAKNMQFSQTHYFQAIHVNDLVVADLNADGRPDIITAAIGKGVAVLLNRTAPELKFDRATGVLSWPAWAGYVLEYCSELSTNQWLQEMFQGDIQSGIKQLNVTTVDTSRFWRVRKTD
ncbi:MAG: FG-GAP repeat domain-containing protein [Limisphaerales bacterium]